MAISVNWYTKVISVPQADLTLISGSLYELDVDWFRLQLKNLEDDPTGMSYPDTHRHNTEVTLGGVTLARTVEIINEYTVTFEDGQYAVRLVGANNNIADVMNVNQVSLRSNNSAGLIVSGSGVLPQDKIDIAEEVANAAYEGSLSLREAVRLMLAVLAGKVSGAAGPTVVFRDAEDVKDRVTATVDGSGNRTAVSLDAS
jgi:hypothetical protein